MKKSIIMQMPFFPVGSLIQVNHVDYQVIKGEGCDKCCFCVKDYQECVRDTTRFGHCSASLRFDDEDVIFVELKNQ